MFKAILDFIKLFDESSNDNTGSNQMKLSPEEEVFILENYASDKSYNNIENLLPDEHTHIF